MRFKKLRLFVALAILIFIIVAGNIIITGMLHKSYQDTATIVDNKKSASAKLIVTDAGGTTTTTSTNANTNTNNPQTQTQPTPQPTPAPTVVVQQPTIRTRAS